MESETGYFGNPTRDKWAEVFVELVIVALSLMIFGIEVTAWIALGLVAWRIKNIGKRVI